MEQESVNYWISVGEKRAEERIIKLLEEEKAIECKKVHCQSITDGHDYECLSEEIDGYIALVKGEQIDHLGEAIRATAWAYTEGEQPNPLIKGESQKDNETVSLLTEGEK